MWTAGETECCAIPRVDEPQRRVLRTVLGINAALFVAELGAGLLAHSTALLADVADVLGDGIVYGFSLHGILSYAAGLTPMRLLPFLVATGIGMTPATFLMAWAGDLGAGTLGPLIGWPLGIAALAGGAAWLPSRVRARPGLPAGVGPEG